MTRLETLDGLATLVAFPRQEAAPLARECSEAFAAWCPEASDAVGRFADFAARTPLPALQDAYTATFDFEPSCSLELGWHLFGEAFQRGEFLACVREDLVRAGLAETHGLPDHLSHVLSLVAREEPARAAAFAAFVAPAVAAARDALTERGSPYVDLLKATCSFLDNTIRGFRLQAEEDTEANTRTRDLPPEGGSHAVDSASWEALHDIRRKEAGTR